MKKKKNTLLLLRKTNDKTQYFIILLYCQRFIVKYDTGHGQESTTTFGRGPHILK